MMHAAPHSEAWALAHCEPDLAMPYTIRRAGDAHAHTAHLGWEIERSGDREVRVVTPALLRRAAAEPGRHVVIPWDRDAERKLAGFWVECARLDAERMAAAARRGRGERDREVGERELLTAAKWGDVVTLKALLCAGTDVNCRDGEGRTALMTAAFWGRATAAVALLLWGAEKKIG